VASVKSALGESEVLVPDDLVMASASGLDPDISLNAALVQVSRVAKARSISEEELRALIFHLEEPALLGLFPRRVNVLVLNCALDQHYGQETT
jgi:K+-transporting ATPase ATPase C chain